MEECMRYGAFRSQLLVSTVLLLIASSAQAELFEGPPVRIGNGEAKTLVRTGPDGQASAISIVFTPGMLDGLPAANHDHPDVPFTLKMPTSGPKTMINHVVINWNAHGHQPARIYDVPHFDFHFYLVDEEHRKTVTFTDDKASGDPSQQPPAELLPAGYKVPPGTAVSNMGVHAVNVTGPEFQGKPFTTTFIYGYYDKRLTFVEPMVTVDYLKSKPSFREQIPTPQKYSFDGHYPTAYGVRFDAAANRYEISLEDLK
jgi:hypothetical protein